MKQFIKSTLSEIFLKYKGESPPPGYKWSDEIWICRKDDWTALFRPLNLGVVYLEACELDAVISIDSGLTDYLIAENFLLPAGSDSDTSERENLIETARSGKFRFICILPTTECNFACSYCHQRPAVDSGRTMSDVEIRDGLSRCAELCTDLSKPVDILIYGGEPLLAFDQCRKIFELTSQESSLFRQNVRLSFTTSGYGLTTEQVKIMRDHDVFVIVSLDGIGGQNDKVRVSKSGDSAYMIAGRALDMLKNTGCRIGISVTLGWHNIENLEENLTFLLDRFEPDDIGLNAFLHSSGDKSNKFQLDAETAFSAIVEGMNICRKLSVFAEQPFRRLKPFVYRKPLLKDCSSPGERLVLTPDGLMGFCDSMYPRNQYFYNTENFGTNLEDYETWRSLSSPELPVCKTCPAMTVCGGACRYDAYMAGGSLDGVDPLRCEVEKKLLNWMIWDLFNNIRKQNERFTISADYDRKIMFGSISLTSKNQPFIAGTYSG